MKGHLLCDLAGIRNFFQVTVHLLIARYRQQSSLVDALWIIFIAIQNFECRRK